MAIYTTLFLSQPVALPGGFPGWRLPLAQPVRREFKNPFTGKVTTIETREPEWPEQESTEAADQQYQVVAIEGSYENYLESRLPAFVRACPHWATKGLTEIELNPLIEAAGVSLTLECTLYSPPARGALLQQFPQEILPKLAALDQRELEAVASRWAATMSSPKHTHSVAGTKISDGWTMSDAMDCLRPILSLGRQTANNQRMYLLIEA